MLSLPKFSHSADSNLYHLGQPTNNKVHQPFVLVSIWSITLFENWDCKVSLVEVKNLHAKKF